MEASPKTDSELLESLVEVFYEGTIGADGNPPLSVIKQGIVEYLIADHARIEENEQLLRAVSEAINNKGRYPKYHLDIMARQRKEWPILWRVLDRISQSR